MTKSTKKRIKLLLVSTFIIINYGIICLILTISIYHYIYKDKVYPGVYIENKHLGNWTQDQVSSYFANKNSLFANITLVFTYKDNSWTLPSKDINWGYNPILISTTAFNYGRDKDLLTNLQNKYLAFTKPISIDPQYQ